MNPIIDREVRTRWRRLQSFSLVMAWSFIFAVAIYFFYSVRAHPFYNTPPSDVRLAAAETGRQLFKSLSLMQAAAWMLLAPMLTATSIAGERERGLLESLQLSPLRPSQIIIGKLFSSVAFILLLMLAVLPVLAICFLMGGVTPGHFVLLILLQLITACCGASIGIFLSARCRRALGALTQSVIVVVAWALLALPLSDYSLYTPYRSWEDYLPVLALWTNPIMAAYALTEPNAVATTSATASIFSSAIPPWTVSFIFQILLSVVLLTLAIRKVRKPLPEIVPTDKRWSDKWQAQIRQMAAERAAAREKQRMSEKAQSALFSNVPLEKFIRFRNPVLQREVRGGFRWRGGSVWRTALQLGSLILGGSVFTIALAIVTDPVNRGGAWRTISFGMLFLAILVSAVMGAKGFTRERESGTWEGLYLSLLEPRETLWGKSAAPLVTCFYYSLPAWFLLAFCLNFSDAPVTQTDIYSIHNSPLSLSGMAILFLLFASAIWCYSAWGLLISRFCKRTVTSVTWTLVSLMLILVALPNFTAPIVAHSPYLSQFSSALLSTLTGYQMPVGYYGENLGLLQCLWHPAYSLDYLQGNGYAPLPEAVTSVAVLINVLLLFVMGCIFLAIVQKSMRHVDGFEPERLRANVQSGREYLKFRWK